MYSIVSMIYAVSPKTCIIKEYEAWPGTVGHICNHNTLEAEAGISQGQEFQPSLVNIVKSHL